MGEIKGENQDNKIMCLKPEIMDLEIYLNMMRQRVGKKKRKMGDNDVAWRTLQTSSLAAMRSRIFSREPVVPRTYSMFRISNNVSHALCSACIVPSYTKCVHTSQQRRFKILIRIDTGSVWKSWEKTTSAKTCSPIFITLE